ncbi:unnamed protein product, partial [Brassica rapa]
PKRTSQIQEAQRPNQTKIEKGRKTQRGPNKTLVQRKPNKAATPATRNTPQRERDTCRKAGHDFTARKSPPERLSDHPPDTPEQDAKRDKPSRAIDRTLIGVSPDTPEQKPEQRNRQQLRRSERRQRRWFAIDRASDITEGRSSHRSQELTVSPKEERPPSEPKSRPVPPRRTRTAGAISQPHHAEDAIMRRSQSLSTGDDRRKGSGEHQDKSQISSLPVKDR